MDTHLVVHPKIKVDLKIVVNVTRKVTETGTCTCFVGVSSTSCLTIAGALTFGFFLIFGERIMETSSDFGASRASLSLMGSVSLSS